MNISKAIGIYTIAMVIQTHFINAVVHNHLSVGMAVGVYILLGGMLSRIVLRNLIEWHPVYNTLGRISSAKFWMMLLWPLQYPVLFFQLAVNKLL